MSTLETAIALAAKSHEGQTDKAGDPYVLHPLRVMQSVSGSDAQIVAVLHDVLEDCDVSADDLRDLRFSETVIAAIESVTKKPSESYTDFVARAAADPLGRIVKRADIMDNMDLSRLPSPTAKDYARIEKYRRALDVLDAGLTG